MQQRKMTIKSERRAAILFIMPFMLGAVIFYLIPFLMSLYYSAVESFSNHRFVFLGNYIELFTKGAFVLALKNTVLFTLLALPAQMLISFILAFMADRALKKPSWFSSSVLLPMLLPLSAFYHFTLVIFSDNGILNRILSFFGLTGTNWLGSLSVFWVLLYIYIWRFIGLTTLLYISGLQAIPKDYDELAKTEGASAWQRVFAITIPVLTPVHFIVFILSLSNSLGVFKEIYLLGGRYPQPNVYMIQNYINNAFIALDYQKLSTACVVSILLITGILVLWKNLNNKYNGDIS